MDGLVISLDDRCDLAVAVYENLRRNDHLPDQVG